MKRFLFTLLLLVVTVDMWTHHKLDNLYYNFRTAAEVTYEETCMSNYDKEFFTYYDYYDEKLITPKSISIVIPNEVKWCARYYPVTSIGECAFMWCKDMTSVTIPNSVTFIGCCAFSHCSGLTSVTIPNSVTSIGYGAFSDCNSLTSVTIPNSVTSISWNAFEDCCNLTSITIPNSVKTIGYGTFKNCIKLTSITIPNSVTKIKKGAFSGCTNLTSIIIPKETVIEPDAFEECPNIKIIRK